MRSTYKNEPSGVQASGLGTSGVLGIVFIALKLTGVIDWSWWWVLSPYWITFAVFVATIAILLVSAFVKVRRDTW